MLLSLPKCSPCQECSLKPNGDLKLFFMKSLLSVFFILVLAQGFSQKRSETLGVSKTKLTEVQLITELIKDIPADCKVTGYIFSIKTKDKTVKIHCVGNELRIEIQDAFKKADKGDLFSFNKLETACLEKHKKKYSFIITN